MPASKPIKVLIVDDSALVRSMFQRVLSEETDIVVAGCAKDPFEARELIIAERPHVIILDIEMPRMDGITFLRKLAAHYPVPVIMCSGVTASNGAKALEAIAAGAIELVAKPTSGGRSALRQLGEELAEKIRAAAMASPPPPPIPSSASAAPASFRAAGIDPARHLVAIGASTGGTEAIASLLRNAPEDFPPVAVVQHMPAGFTRSFAERLNGLSRMTVTEAVDGDVLVPGRAFVAPGGVQMAVQVSGSRWTLRRGGSEPVNRHCPSVEVLFDSVARQLAPRAVGVILTGMGADGAHALLRMRQAGAQTIGQAEQSCVVYGMPKVAAEIGAVQHTTTPAEVPALVQRLLQATRRSQALPAR
jgi:two-component system chemotaxis response regulator CheB